MVVVAKERRSPENLQSLTAELRTLANEHVSLGRRLMVLAHQLETGEVDPQHIPDPHLLGDVVAAKVGRIIRGEGYD